MDDLGNQRANNQAHSEAPLPRVRRPGKPPGLYPCKRAALRVSNVSESEKQTTEAAEQEALPLSVGPSRKGVPGRPRGYVKTGGKRKGSANRTPLLAQAIANRHSPDAVDYLVGVMQGKRFSRNGHWVYPSVYTRTSAAMKILDIAQLPGRSLLGGTPVQVNISIGGSGPVTIEGGTG